MKSLRDHWDVCWGIQGKCICRNSADLILIRPKGFGRHYAPESGIDQWLVSDSSKAGTERCLGLIVFEENQRCVLVGSLEGSSVKTCTAGLKARSDVV